MICDAESSRQPAVLHDAWREYAATATRPYAWKTFSLYARQQLLKSGDWSRERCKEKLTPWQDGARALSRVLVLGAYAALRVRGGALEIEHGPHDNRETIRIDIDAEPKPRAILFDSHGEFMTGEAIRWCARYSINLALPGGPGRLITIVETALETKTNTKTRMRDIDPSIIRAQCAADAIEPLRPAIDAKVFAFVEAHEFARRDFPQSGYNVHRLSRDVTQLLLHKCSLPSREIEEFAEWIARTIVRCAGVKGGRTIDDSGRREATA